MVFSFLEALAGALYLECATQHNVMAVLSLCRERRSGIFESPAFGSNLFLSDAKGLDYCVASVLAMCFFVAASGGVKEPAPRSTQAYFFLDEKK